MAEQKTSGNSAAAQGEAQQEFGLQKIYVKDISFEAPGAPEIFLQEWKPETNVQLNSQARPVDDKGAYEVELTITVTTRSADQTAYLVEVKQAGVFLVRGMPEDQLGPLLSAYCPNILFPFARETISDLVIRGGFPQLLLAPINFDALYAQKLNAQKAGESAPADTQATGSQPQAN